MGELIGNEDGEEKQDCARNVAKRWISTHAEAYIWLNPNMQGDNGARDEFYLYVQGRDAFVAY